MAKVGDYNLFTGRRLTQEDIDRQNAAIAQLAVTNPDIDLAAILDSMSGPQSPLAQASAAYKARIAEEEAEAARQAALAGDQEGLMRELVAQAGSLEKLQSMNVIQQQALAGALGLSADQLADQVLNGEALATQKDEELAREAAAAEAQAKALSASEAQAVAMQKLADIFSVAMPILVGLAVAAASLAVALTFGAGAAGILSGVSLTAAGVSAAIGTAAGGAVALMSDGTLKPGGPYAITDTSKPFGSTVITAKGDGVAVSPNIRQEGAGNASMAETNKLIRAALSRPAPSVNLDSIEIGTVAGLSAFPIQ